MVDRMGEKRKKTKIVVLEKAMWYATLNKYEHVNLK